MIDLWFNSLASKASPATTKNKPRLAKTGPVSPHLNRAMRSAVSARPSIT
jgi:hypothetical protein